MRFSQDLPSVSNRNSEPGRLTHHWLDLQLSHTSRKADGQGPETWELYQENRALKDLVERLGGPIVQVTDSYPYGREGAWGLLLCRRTKTGKPRHPIWFQQGKHSSSAAIPCNGQTNTSSVPKQEQAANYVPCLEQCKTARVFNHEKHNCRPISPSMVCSEPWGLVFLFFPEWGSILRCKE